MTTVPPFAVTVIKDLISEINNINKNWERGDLAAAVGDAEGAADAAAEWLIDRGLAKEKDFA